MKRLKKGPEIKLSELHMPQVLVDLYYDLKDRHLLPVVGLLLAGIVAVPLLLGGSSASEEPVPGASASAAPPPARTSSLVVTKEAAPLRDYKRRLDHLAEKNPFVQQYVQEEGAEGEGGSDSGSGEVTIPGGEEESPPPGGEGSPPVTNPGEREVIYYTYAMDVRVVPVSVDGKPSKAEPSVRRDLPPLTMLPSRSTPALTYLGTTKDGQKALMLVSSDVTAIFGDSPCAVGSETCQLLALKIGEPETVVFGANARTYRIELLKLELERTDSLNRASLGDDSDGPRPHPRGESPAPAG